MKYLFLATSISVLAPCAALAQTNPTYQKGDLVLYFQEEGGANTIYANLGNSALLFRGSASGPGAANLVNFLNINTELVEAFGATWASKTTVYAGLAAVRSTSSTVSTLFNGDPPRTIYVSRARGSVGVVGQSDSTGWTVSNTNSMTNAASRIDSMNNVFQNQYTTQVAVSPIGVSFIDNADQNPFLAQGVQGNAYITFAGGVQQAGTAVSFGSFGAAGEVEFAVDLYRILARTDVVDQVGGPLRDGTYEGTVTINSSGQVSFISQGAAPVSNYDTWMTTFNPPLTDANDRLPNADPDNDGFDNLEEFVLNGNPSVSSQSIAPLLDASGADFLFSFTRRDDSVTEAPATFQYGSDLAGWTDVPVAANGTFDGVNVAVTPGDAVTDAVVVTLPKSKAVGGKLFGRLQMVK